MFLVQETFYNNMALEEIKWNPSQILKKQHRLKRDNRPPKRLQQLIGALSAEELLSAQSSSRNGLQPADAEQRLKQYGPNTIRAKQQTSALRLLLNQFKSPLVLILIFAAIVSGFVGQWVDAIIVLAIVLGSTILGFVQEYTASNSVEKLHSKITIKSSLLRGGQLLILSSAQVVPGDVVMLSAGSLIPADGIVLEAKDFFVNQAVLTGETFPVEKEPAIVPVNASLTQRTNCVFMGTSDNSGTAQVIDYANGKRHGFRSGSRKIEIAPAGDRI